MAARMNAKIIKKLASAKETAPQLHKKATQNLVAL